MPKPATVRRAWLPLLVAVGLLAWLGALRWAHERLPEWRAPSLPGQQLLQRTFADAAARSGIRLVGSSANIEVAEHSRTQRLTQEYPLTDAPREADLTLRLTEDALLEAPDSLPYSLTLWLDSAGRPQSARWLPGGWNPLASIRLTSSRFDPDFIAKTLLRPGERLGPTHNLSLSGLSFDAFDVLGSQHPEYILVGNVVFRADASRNPGSAADLISGKRRWNLLEGSLKRTLTQVLILAIVVTFGVLAIRRRLSLINALWLALLCCLPIAFAVLAKGDPGAIARKLLLLAFGALAMALLWAAAESLWRISDPKFDGRLDALRLRHLSPLTGRALTAGVGFGLLMAALATTCLCAVSSLPGGTVHGLSVDLPILSGSDGPFSSALFLASTVGFLLAAARRLGKVRGAVTAIAVGAVFLSPVHLQPWGFELGADALLVAVLVIAGLTGGPLTLLTAALVSQLLPAAVFSGEHFATLPGSFFASAGFLLIIVATALIAQFKKSPAEGALPQPSFVRRLEGERRREVEMDLVARMQRGLLPRALPRISGWEVAARSELADRAGGDLYDVLQAPDGAWWIVAGDVAGHGVSCAISQAIVKATLVGLLTSSRGMSSPSATLTETDRVLRATAPERSFTTVVLIRFEPATGRALVSNAGHPYPLLVEPGQRPREIALPGLPLGQGPARRYDDAVIELKPGSVIVVCSDGLIEARSSAGDAPYGFERPLDHLASIASRHADDILEDLFIEWQAFRGPGAPDDDTTVVVLRRLPAGARDTWAPPPGDA
jgi:hypothetical protein